MKSYIEKAKERFEKLHAEKCDRINEGEFDDFLEQELKGLLEEVKKPKEKSERDYIAIGFHKGEMDFSVNCSIGEITKEEMDELRIMTCVAIGQAEQMWRKKRQQLLGLQTSSNRE